LLATANFSTIDAARDIMNRSEALAAAFRSRGCHSNSLEPPCERAVS
jgi:hypothetical protein